MTPSHRDYQPEDLLHVELCQNPRRYEATMSDFQVLVLPSVTSILDGRSSGDFAGTEATRLGTIFHAYAAEFEVWLQGFAARLSREDRRVINCATLWADWRGVLGALGFPAQLVEVPVCSIRHGFAGTLDVLHSGWITDHKTSQESGERDLIQAVAYGMALEEMLQADTAPASVVPYALPLCGAQVLRFGKADQAGEVRRLPRAGWEPLWIKFLSKLEARLQPA